MNYKIFLIVFVLLLLFSSFVDAMVLTDSRAVIRLADNFESEGERLNYLLQGAKRFMYEEKYEHAIIVAQYILNKIDHQSTEAMYILKNAKTEQVIQKFNH